jgi:hypothetical protein
MFDRDQFAGDLVAFLKQRAHKVGRWEERGLRRWAAECGVSAPTLQRMTKGRTPDVETFLRVCAWMGRSADRYWVPPVGTQLVIT